MFYGVPKDQVDAFEDKFITSMASILSVDSSEISFTTSQIGKDVIVRWKFSKSIVITRSDSSLDDLLIAEMSNQGSFTDLLSIVIYQRQISAVSVSDVDFYRDELVQTMLDAVDDLNAIVDVSFISSGTDAVNDIPSAGSRGVSPPTRSNTSSSMLSAVRPSSIETN